jgi:hypothetical protein
MAGDVDALGDILSKLTSLQYDIGHNGIAFSKALEVLVNKEQFQMCLLVDITGLSNNLKEVNNTFESRKTEISIAQARYYLRQAEDYLSLANSYTRKANVSSRQILEKIREARKYANDIRKFSQAFAVKAQVFTAGAQTYIDNARTPAERQELEEWATRVQVALGTGEDLADAAQVDIEKFGGLATFVGQFNSTASKQAIEAEALVIEIEKKIHLAEVEEWGGQSALEGGEWGVTVFRGPNSFKG